MSQLRGEAVAALERDRWLASCSKQSRSHALTRIVRPHFAQAVAASRLAGCRCRKFAGECRRDHCTDRGQFAGAARQLLARRAHSRLRSSGDDARARSGSCHRLGAGQYQVQSRRTSRRGGSLIPTTRSPSASKVVAQLSVLQLVITLKGVGGGGPFSLARGMRIRRVPPRCIDRSDPSGRPGQCEILLSSRGRLP
jgi:hypothetical protein